MANVKNCDPLQQSLDWCEGTPNFAGIRRRLFYCCTMFCLTMPKIQLDAAGRPMSGVVTGEFTMKEGATFKHIDIVPEKSQANSTSQGEYPNQTSLDKLVAVHQGRNSEASGAVAGLHNSRNVYIVEDINGRAYIIGFEDAWPAKTTVETDFGQGPTGTPGTTITVEATNRVPWPEFRGKIMTDIGEIDYSKNS